MLVPKMLQVYFGNSGIYGDYGDPRRCAAA